METSNIKKYVIVGAIVLFLVIIGIIIYSSGTKGLANIAGSLMTVLIWIGLGFLVALIAYFLFIYEKRINASFEVYKAIKSEARINRLDNLKNLILSGDEKYSRPVFVGKVIGFSSRKTYQEEVKETGKYFQNETIFAVKRATHGLVDWFVGLFRGIVLIRTPSILHTDLHGDVIVKCNSLVKHGHYYYPDVIHLDTKAIDTTLYYEGERFIQLNFISKIEPVISRAVGVTREDIKLLRGRTGIELLREKGESVTGRQQNTTQ